MAILSPKFVKEKSDGCENRHVWSMIFLEFLPRCNVNTTYMDAGAGLASVIMIKVATELSYGSVITTCCLEYYGNIDTLPSSCDYWQASTNIKCDPRSWDCTFGLIIYSGYQDRKGFPRIN